MIKILKQNQYEIIVQNGSSIYSTTPETAPPKIRKLLQEKPKKTNTKKNKNPTK